MTNHIEEAKKTLGEASGISEAHALIAIAESLEQIHSQLQLANRIAIGMGAYHPDMDELLGMKDEA